MSKMTELLTGLETAQSGIFADRDTIKEAYDYATEVLTSAGPNEKPMAIMVSLGVLQNTILKVIAESLTEAIEENEA